MIAAKAHFDGKVIVPDEPVALPKNQPLVVHVEVVKKPKRKKKKGISALRWLAENAVEDDSLPTDLSYQHNHYLYGTPKKPEPDQKP